MKPCSNRRKSIALLALEELDGREAQELRSHIRACEGCSQYLEGISAVTERMAVAVNNSEIEASDAFHRNVVARLRTVETANGRGIAGLLGDLLNWRVVLPTAVICVVLLIGLCVQRQAFDLRPQQPPSTPAQIISASNAKAEVAPTIGNYQAAADQSLQKFDELLDREAKQAPPTVPSYSASSLAFGVMGE